MLTPRLLLLMSLLTFPLGARAGTETAPVPDLPGIKAGPPVGPDVEPVVVVSSETVRALEKIGWKVGPDGGLSRIAGGDKGVIPKDYPPSGESRSPSTPR